MHADKPIAESTVRRLSLYLRVLEHAMERGIRTISSEELADEGGTTSAQVRKDLSFFGSFGTRGRGYHVAELVSELQRILGLGREWRVYIIGAGKIGAALASYHGFVQRGFTVLGIYDNDPRLVGTIVDGVTVRDFATLADDARRESPEIVVLAVPGEVAQAVAERVVAAGIHAILNFAPVPLHVPAHITVRSVNMALELEGLAYAIVHRDSVTPAA
ncbi:MAG: redox-sensing transcriptional repressor Rex [Gemmatimonadaceae bacterium]|nr:redox-sensing transcriptional repressor Rex [Gemmatimonadaceae bacterium]